MGWVRQPDGVLWHNGSNSLWYAEVGFSPETGVVAAIAANDGDMTEVGPPVSRLLRQLIQTAGAEEG